CCSPRPSLFPYTTLFRSASLGAPREGDRALRLRLGEGCPRVQGGRLRRAPDEARRPRDADPNDREPDGPRGGSDEAARDAAAGIAPSDERRDELARGGRRVGRTEDRA